MELSVRECLEMLSNAIGRPIGSKLDKNEYVEVTIKVSGEMIDKIDAALAKPNQSQH